MLNCRRQLPTLSVKGVYIFGKYLTGHRRLGFQAIPTVTEVYNFRQVIVARR